MIVAVNVGLFLLGSPTEAAAQAKPKVIAECPLERSPFLYSAAMPDDLACIYDEDGNGLDDDVEQQIAECFVPQFRFDVAEFATRNLGVPCAPRGAAYASTEFFPDSYAPGSPDFAAGTLCEEPHPLFNIVPVAAAPADGGLVTRLQLRWVFTYARDGGTPDCGWVGFFPVNTAHPGDTESARMVVDIVRGGDRWYARVTTASELVFNVMDGVTPTFLGTHPVVYLSAGKHHPYGQAHAAWNWSGAGPATYTDVVNGNGAIVQPSRVDHIPHFHGGATLPTTNDGRRFLNACTLARTGVAVPATRRLRPNVLWDLGFQDDWVDRQDRFVGDSSATCDPGCSKASPIREINESPSQTWLDPDGDGFLNVWQAGLPGQPIDKCPWKADGQMDFDADGLGNACDPALLYKSEYVAGGAPGKPAATSSVAWNGHPRGGFLDTDMDGSPDGLDSCPFTIGGVFDTNGDGERFGWPDPSAAVVAGYRQGIFRRGDACDPNPVAVPQLLPPPEMPALDGCNPGTWFGPYWWTFSTGADVAAITNTAIRGESANGPSPVLAASTTVKAQTYRCACRTVGQVPIDDPTACLQQPDSECYVGDFGMQPAPASAKGHGWVTVYRPDCTPESCPPYDLPVLMGSTTPSTIEWDWLRELSDLPPSHAKARFDANDFNFAVSGGAKVYSQADAVDINGKPSFDSTFRYVIWTQTFVGSSLGVPTKPNRLPDPETLDPDLANVNHPKSMALRAGFSPTSAVLRAARMQSTLIDLPDCPEAPTEMLFPEYSGIWISDPGCPPWMQAPDDLRVLTWEGGGPLSTGKLLRPGPEESPVLIAGYDESTTWLFWAAGAGALLTPMTQQLGNMDAWGYDFWAPAPAETDPDLLWVERESQAPRWARLTAIDHFQGTTVYAVIASGALDAPVSDLAMLAQSEDGQGAALFDPMTGMVCHYDSVLGDFTHAESMWQQVF